MKIMNVECGQNLLAASAVEGVKMLSGSDSNWSELQ
jgi:hypothetical protein